MTETSQVASAETTSSTSKTWSPTLAKVLVSSLAGFSVGAIGVASLHPFFPFADLPELGISPNPELVKKHVAATYAFHSMNLAFNLGVMGLCVGAFLGLITTARSRIFTATSAGGIGLLLGAVSGYLVGLYVAKAAIASSDQSLIESTVVHFLSWVGILGCVIFFLGYVQAGAKKADRYLIAGIVSAVLLAVIYNLVTSLLFPQANLLVVIPSTLYEAISWVLVCALSLVCGLKLGLNEKKPNQVSESLVT